MTEGIERTFEKIEKYLAYAARGGSENERAQAAKLIARTLKASPVPIRWYVPQGTECRVVPSLLMNPQDLRAAKATIRVVQLRQDHWYQERDRVRVDDDLALEKGYLYFERNGFAVFVPVSAITARL